MVISTRKDKLINTYDSAKHERCSALENQVLERSFI